MRKAILLAVAVGVAGLGLSGCGGSEGTAEPEGSFLSVKRDGTVTAVTVEEVGNSEIYTEEELRASTEEYLEAFNGTEKENADGEARAVLRECVLADGEARLAVEFADGAAYLEFMELYPDEESAIQVTGMDVVPVPDGIAKGYLTGAAFVDSAGKTVDSGEVMKQTNAYVARVEGPAVIMTEGRLTCVTEGTEFVNRKAARTPDEGISYLIFE